MGPAGRARKRFPLATMCGLAAVCGALAAGCSDPEGPQQPRVASIRVLGGDGQSGTAGQLLPGPLMVIVLDHEQRGVPGVSVSFTAQQGSGSVSPQESLTDATGMAQSRWTIGGSAVQQATASVLDWQGTTLSALFTAQLAP